MIREVEGDILLSKAQVVAHGVAPGDHFDSGLALALRERWPAMVKDFRHYCQSSHPKTGEIYACSNPAELLLVSEKTGEVTVVGPMNLENKAAHCDNLAAPWVPVPCVDNK